MNKILIINDLIESKYLDDSIEIEMLLKNETYDVNKLKIRVLKDTYLEIDYIGNEDYKLNISFKIDPNVDFTLFEKKTGNYSKIQYKYELKDYSIMTINRFYNVDGINQCETVYLDGKMARLDYNFKTISTLKEKYDLAIHHLKEKTISNVYNAAVNTLEGEIAFNVSSFVPQHIKGCEINQSGRIINLNNNDCIINPNLYIEESDVIANHAAAIGKFSDEEMFYMMSRGISYENAINLLIKGFLIGDFNISENRLSEIKEIVDGYWR